MNLKALSRRSFEGRTEPWTSLVSASAYLGPSLLPDQVSEQEVHIPELEASGVTAKGIMSSTDSPRQDSFSQGLEFRYNHLRRTR
jgi:hypothetical protein